MSKPEPVPLAYMCASSRAPYGSQQRVCPLCRCRPQWRGPSHTLQSTHQLQGPTPTPTLCSLQVDCSEDAVSSVVTMGNNMTAAPWLPGPPSTSAARDGAGPGLTEPRVRDTEVGETPPPPPPPPPPQPPHSTVCTVCHRSHFIYSTDTTLNKYPLLQHGAVYTLYQTL